MQEDLGWRKLEEKREGMKVLFGSRLEGLEESRLVKMVVDKLRNVDERASGEGYMRFL